MYKQAISSSLTTMRLPHGNGSKAIHSNGLFPEVLIITSYPPRQCGIATYSQDLKMALDTQFSQSFSTKICALESATEKYEYSPEVQYILDTDNPESYIDLANKINANGRIYMVMLQHEFGLFCNQEPSLRGFLAQLEKPVIIVFHTVLPNPNALLMQQVTEMVDLAASVVVMTNRSEQILCEQYGVSNEKVAVIPHGTHLVPHADQEALKAEKGLTDKKILSTFGLLSSGKNIETTLRALPAIIAENPNVLFLIIGRTHPTVQKQEGNRYREMLDSLISELSLQEHVQYVNYYLPLPELLTYLQLTDIYLFTSHDPNQAVSGTFSYALSCGCPVISTPIPHAVEVLGEDAGMIIDFGSSTQLSAAVNKLLADDELMDNMSMNALHRMAPTAWQNSAIAHAILIEQFGKLGNTLRYNVPSINLDHIYRLTTSFGMVQFSRINQPDIESGYTLDDNARALIAMCQHYELTGSASDIKLITIYVDFIKFCLQPEGFFLNYVDKEYTFTAQNNQCNLADANGRAIWALGYALSLGDLLPVAITDKVSTVMQTALLHTNHIHSTRAMAFIIKGLYYRNLWHPTEQDVSYIKYFADRMVQMYRHEAEDKWKWFESYLTYANSILPEAMLCAWLATGESVYKETAIASFDFLLAHTFTGNHIRVISNRNWFCKNDSLSDKPIGGEQPIDVAYTIMTLSKFYDTLGKEEYRNKMFTAFSWFLGNNYLHRIIYNPCTGGCYDGLETTDVNLNQGAESTLSYLMARLTVEQYKVASKLKPQQQKTKLGINTKIAV